MLFNTLEFLAFFGVVWPIYWLSPRTTLRNLFLLAAGLWFYSRWNWLLALVLVVSTTVDYLLARRIDHTPDGPHRTFLLRTSVGMNLGLLVIFKYLDFLMQNLGWVLSISLPDLTMPNPVGISFYTFEAISYTVDVYRRKVRAETRVDYLLLFITFFPHVVAGPIVRARAFLPQIGRWKHWNWKRFEVGISYFVLGLFKKAALADRLALIVDPIFLLPHKHSSLAVAAGILAYGLQVYCDFSGYSDMAIGLAHMLGFRLAPNFHMPYSSRNVSEFWRRWHISLSSWLRDYLYIPLGGNSGGLRTYRNLMLTMLLGGMWHGASWNFLLWGALHGLFLCIHRLYRQRRWFALGNRASWLLCFSCVTLAWVPFRSKSIPFTCELYRKLLAFEPGSGLSVAWSSFLFSVAVVVVAHQVGGHPRWRQAYWKMPPLWVGTGLAVMAYLAFCLAPKFSEPFIYFQF